MGELRLKWKPEVYLVGRQVVDQVELGRFLDSRGASGWLTDAPSAAEALVETAGRACYMSYNSPRPGGNGAYVGHILESRHGSVCEHAVFNMIFAGISRSLSHELIRHRAGWGYSELSQRFVDSSNVAFVVPPALADEVLRHLDDPLATILGRNMDGGVRMRGPLDHRPGHRWIDGRKVDLAEYESHADYLFEKYAAIPDKTARRKAAREAARSVLPNATETTIFVTGNARAIRNMLEQRGAIGADAEFRRLACEVARLMKRESPNLFADVEVWPEAQFGGEQVVVKHSKV